MRRTRLARGRRGTDIDVTDLHRITIENITQLTPDVRSFVCTRPDGYEFEAGQATEVALDRDGWTDERRPFTFSSMPDDDHLEFTIKSYPDHDGVTEQIGELSEGDHLLIDDPWGAITDKGPGVFIAGGAGITPFLSILRTRAAAGDVDGCHLIFSNTTEADIICRSELEAMDSLTTTLLVTSEPESPLAADQLDRESLAELIDDFDQRFYVCGPPAMTEAIGEALDSLGADTESVSLDDQV